MSVVALAVENLRSFYLREEHMQFLRRFKIDNGLPKPERSASVCAGECPQLRVRGGRTVPNLAKSTRKEETAHKKKPHRESIAMGAIGHSI